jgi:hypothetical protein
MFRFSIRDVLWLTVVVGLGCAWWIEHLTVGAERDRLQRELETERTLRILAKQGFFLDPADLSLGYDRTICADGTTPTRILSGEDGPFRSVPWRTVGSPQSASLGRPKFLSHERELFRLDGQPVLVVAKK